MVTWTHAQSPQGQRSRGRRKCRWVLPSTSARVRDEDLARTLTGSINQLTKDICLDTSKKQGYSWLITFSSLPWEKDMTISLGAKQIEKGGIP